MIPPHSRKTTQRLLYIYPYISDRGMEKREVKNNNNNNKIMHTNTESVTGPVRFDRTRFDRHMLRLNRFVFYIHFQ